LLTTISIGMAMVSNGTISVAMMMASTRSRPRHFRKTKANAASEQTKSDSRHRGDQHRIEDEGRHRRPLERQHVVRE
jgi:hypothetical protein